MTYSQTPPPGNVPYEIAPQRSKAAIAALVLGLIGLIPLIGIPFGIAAIICGIAGLINTSRPPHNVTGKGMAIAGLVIGGLSVLMAPVVILIAILIPSLGRARELANRSYCAANLHGLAQSMIVYSNENNDVYPVLPYAPYSSANAGTPFSTASGTTDAAINSLYSGTSTQAGSPMSGMWLLVLRSQCSPKQFICKSDPTSTATGLLQNASGDYYTNFQAGNQFSYSFAYPYTPKGEVGEWWKNTTDSSLPIIADMAPLNGTGSPSHDVTVASTPSSNKIWNSANHQGDGENVTFGDAHTEFVRRPDVGQDSDNIYTLSDRRGTTSFGGTQPHQTPINIRTEKVPFDIIMVPQRNLDTGSL